MSFQQEHWFLKDLQYTYLDDGFTLIAYTNVPCHLACRMTKTPPHKHSLPSYRRGLYLQGDIRFCFVVYEDNDQAEAGDTLVHTFAKGSWPVCERRWFYFIGSIGSVTSVSESPIFEFHFPAPPPEPPPPIERVFMAMDNNRTILSNHVWWPNCWAGANLNIPPTYNAPEFVINSGASLTVTYRVRRGFLTFNTSTLPATAKIINARLELYVTYWIRTSSIAKPYWQATPGHQSDPVVIADYALQNPETTILGQIDYATLNLNQYNYIDLNSDGLSHINLDGLTKYCLRSQLDTDNFPPPLGGNAANFHSMQKGIGYRPRLRVFYNPA